MEVTIDSAGRIVIPKKLRDQAALEPGAAFEARYEDGQIILEPRPVPVRFERKGRFVVAVPDAESQPLTKKAVEQVRQGLKKERGIGEG